MSGFDENYKEEVRYKYPHYFQTEHFNRKKMNVERIEKRANRKKKKPAPGTNHNN